MTSQIVQRCRVYFKFGASLFRHEFPPICVAGKGFFHKTHSCRGAAMHTVPTSSQCPCGREERQAFHISFASLASWQLTRVSFGRAHDAAADRGNTRFSPLDRSSYISFIRGTLPSPPNRNAPSTLNPHHPKRIIRPFSPSAFSPLIPAAADSMNGWYKERRRDCDPLHGPWPPTP